MKIKFDKLSLDFQNELGKQLVLTDNLSLEFGRVENRGLTTFLLPMNSGKSTLAETLSESTGKQRGEISFGNSLTTKFISNKISADDSFQFLSLADIYRTFAKVGGYSDGQKQLFEIAKKTGLEGYEEHIPSQKSKGYRFRLLLAYAHFCKSELLILDDPFIKADNTIGLQLIDLIKETAREMQIVLFTSSVTLAALLSDEIILLSGIPLRMLKQFDGNQIAADFQSVRTMLIEAIVSTNKEPFTNYLI